MKTASLSQNIYQKLCEVIPGGVNSPIRSCKAVGQQPVVAASGKGDLLFDPDGKSYIDYCGSWGALLHGHAHPQILAAVSDRMQKGTSFGLTTEIEEKLARKVASHYRSVDQVRFVSSGTEAAMSAVRLARGYTGRDKIIKFNGNYHGHADGFLVQAGSGVTNLSPASSSAGIPLDAVKHTFSLSYNDPENCRRALREHEIAAVILEPIAGNIGVVPAEVEFLQMLREETRKHGALLIFDEVITGFRVGLEGAQGLYGIFPDITVFGKVVGGGFPAAAFGASREIMSHLAPEGNVYQAGTLSGNPVAMEAGFQAVTLAEQTGFYEKLQEKADRITRPVSDYIRKKGLNCCIQQQGSMFTLFFGRQSVRNLEEVKMLDTEMFGKFFRCMCENGVYIPPLQMEAWFVSAAHTDEHLDRTAERVLKFLG